MPAEGLPRLVAGHARGGRVLCEDEEHIGIAVAVEFRRGRKVGLEIVAALDRLDASLQLRYERGRPCCLLRLPALLILGRSVLLPCHGQNPPVIVSIRAGCRVVPCPAPVMRRSC